MERAVICCDGADPYCDLAQRVCASVRAALDNGKHSLAVEAFGSGPVVVPTTEIAIAACVAALAAAGDKPVLLLLPTLDAVGEATSATASWAAGDRERLRVATLSFRGGPADGDEPMGAVVLCGLALNDDGSEALRDARAWLRAAPVAIRVNARVPMLRFEAALYARLRPTSWPTAGRAGGLVP